MAIIRPFRGTYYNKEKVKIENVITQPYDKIDPKLYQEYQRRDSHNAVRLILRGDPFSDSKSDYSYESEAQLLQDWIKSGIFIRDAEEAIYPYAQEFTVLGQKKIREAFIVRGLLHRYEEGVVFPHEETLSKPKADRLNHIRATQTQFGLIFMLYEDPEHEVAALLHSAIEREAPLFDTVDMDYEVRHRVWSIKQKELISRLGALMKGKKLLIADGHHRYETALTFRDEMRKRYSGSEGAHNFDTAMMAFVNLYDPGLVILPTHRLVRNVSDQMMMDLTNLLRKDFRIERLILPQEDRSLLILERMKSAKEDDHIIGLYYGGNEVLLLHYPHRAFPASKIEVSHSEAWRSLDVSILHVLILQDKLGIQDEAVRKEANLSYCRHIDEALEAVNKGRAQLAFLLNPTQPSIVRDIAFGQERMPQKSTDFYPKFMTGLMLNQLDLTA